MSVVSKLVAADLWRPEQADYKCAQLPLLSTRVSVFRMQDLRIELTPPKHGWIKLLVSTESSAIECWASDLCDFLPHLILGVRAILKGRSQASARFTEETNAFELSLVNHDDKTTIEIYTWPEAPEFTRQTHGNLIFSISHDRMQTVLTFWRALVTLQASEGFPQEWYHGFPSSRLQRLSEQIENYYKET